MNKQQKKGVKEVIRKYLGKDPNKHAVIGSFGGGLLAMGVALDFIFAGGLISMGTMVFGGAGVIGSGCVESVNALMNMPSNWKNTADQTIRCKRLIERTLDQIEDKLAEAFEKAMNPQNSSSVRALRKETFHALAREVQEDAEKLSPAFNIVSGARSEKYVFAIQRTGQKTVTLQEALQQLDAPTEQEKIDLLRQEIKELKEKINDDQKHKIIDLNKPKFGPDSKGAA